MLLDINNRKNRANHFHFSREKACAFSHDNLSQSNINIWDRMIDEKDV